MEGFFLRFSLLSTRKRRFRAPKTQGFESAPLPIVESVVWTDGKTEVLKYDVIHHTYLVGDAIVFPSLNRFCVDEQK